ncbi:MAG: Ig-like domain-containing protein, partial [Candidatus Saccharimonadales bacterium]
AEANGKDIFIDNTTLPVTVTDTNTQYIQMNIGNSRVYTLGAPDTTKPAVPTAIMKDANNNVINNPGYINTKDFSFNISDSSSDVTQYKLRYWNDIVGSQYNGESHAWAPTSTNWDGHMNTLGAYLDNFTQGGGVHYFAFSACDAAGNCSDFSTPFTVTYDKIGPSAPSIITPGARQWFNTAPINTTWTAVSDISGINHYQVAYHYDDNHPFSGSTCSGDEINGLLLSGCRDTVSNSRNHNPGLGEEGGVTVWVRAIDNAGNVGPWSQSVNYFYDHTAPTGDISAPGNGLIVKSVNGKLDVSGSVNDNLSMNRVGVQLIKPGVSGQIQYLYDHMVNSNPGNWQVQFDTTGLGLVDGEYGLNVYFVDMAGNVTIKNSTFILDNSAPTVSIDSYVRNDDGTYTITGTTDDTANVIVTIPGDSNSPYTVAPISGVWSITTDPLTDGAYEVTATSTDSAGNEGTATPTPFRFTAAPTQQFAGRGAFLALAPINANIQAPLIVANAQVQPGVVLGNNTATPNITKVKGDSTDTPNSKVAASTTSKDGSKFLGLGWWWLLILAAILAFWWFLAAAKRRRDAEDA